MWNEALGNIQSRSLEVVGKSYEAKTSSLSSSILTAACIHRSCITATPWSYLTSHLTL